MSFLLRTWKLYLQQWCHTQKLWGAPKSVQTYYPFSSQLSSQDNNIAKCGHRELFFLFMEQSTRRSKQHSAENGQSRLNLQKQSCKERKSLFEPRSDESSHVQIRVASCDATFCQMFGHNWCFPCTSYFIIQIILENNSQKEIQNLRCLVHQFTCASMSFRIFVSFAFLNK